MKTTKKILAILLLASLVLMSLALFSCKNDTPTPDGDDDNHKKEYTGMTIGVLSGPTGMGMAQLISETVSSNPDNYKFSVYSDPSLATADLSAGKTDLLCLPTNTAATLYNRDKSLLKIAAVNTLGSLYLLTNGVTINSISDLEGLTVYTSVAGSTTKPILSYILEKNNVNATIEVAKDHDTLVADFVSGAVKIAVLPEPKVTVALIQNSDCRVALNLSSEWDRISDSSLTMGCIVVRSAYLADFSDKVDTFLAKYRASIEYIANRENTDAAAQMIVDAGILPKLPVAKKALTNLYGSIVYLDGGNMKSALVSFYTVLYNSMPKSIGSKLPADGFYYNADKK